MIDRFFRLRHDAVIGCHNENDHISDLRSPRAHQRKGGVTWCVEEYDALILHVDGIGTNVLCDTASLSLSDSCFSDTVEQRCLSMIDVPHYSDHWRSGEKVLWLRVFLFYVKHFFFKGPHLDVCTKLTRDHRCGVRIECCVNRHHDALLKQFLQHILGTRVELVG